MIINTMVDKNIPLADCRAQSYDNVANMADKYKGVQAKILAQYPALPYFRLVNITLSIFVVMMLQKVWRKL